MAYLDLSGPRLALAGAAPSATGVASAPQFNAFEWAVIGLSRHDTPTSLSEPGRFRRALERFFRIRRGNALANPRLEALRRMAVLLRRGVTSPDETARFLASGYSDDQLTALARHVDGKAR